MVFYLVGFLQLLLMTGKTKSTRIVWEKRRAPFSVTDGVNLMIHSTASQEQGYCYQQKLREKNTNEREKLGSRVNYLSFPAG